MTAHAGEDEFTDESIQGLLLSMDILLLVNSKSLSTTELRGYNIGLGACDPITISRPKPHTFYFDTIGFQSNGNFLFPKPRSKSEAESTVGGFDLNFELLEFELMRLSLGSIQALPVEEKLSPPPPVSLSSALKQFISTTRVQLNFRQDIPNLFAPFQWRQICFEALKNKFSQFFKEKPQVDMLACAGIILVEDIKSVIEITKDSPERRKLIYKEFHDGGQSGLIIRVRRHRTGSWHLHLLGSDYTFTEYYLILVENKPAYRAALKHYTSSPLIKAKDGRIHVDDSKAKLIPLVRLPPDTLKEGLIQNLRKVVDYLFFQNQLHLILLVIGYSEWGCMDIVDYLTIVASRTTGDVGHRLQSLLKIHEKLFILRQAQLLIAEWLSMESSMNVAELESQISDLQHIYGSSVLERLRPFLDFAYVQGYEQKLSQKLTALEQTVQGRVKIERTAIEHIKTEQETQRQGAFNTVSTILGALIIFEVLGTFFAWFLPSGMPVGIILWIILITLIFAILTWVLWHSKTTEQ